jgi:hypothetical protein
MLCRREARTDSTVPAAGQTGPVGISCRFFVRGRNETHMMGG